MKKKIFTVLLTIAMMLAVIGCGEKEPQLSGVWILESDKEGFLELYSDGTGIIGVTDDSGEVQNYDCTWIAENSRLKFTIDFGIFGSASESVDYELTKETLTLSYESGTIEIYNRKE